MSAFAGLWLFHFLQGFGFDFNTKAVAEHWRGRGGQAPATSMPVDRQHREVVVLMSTPSPSGPPVIFPASQLHRPLFEGS